MSGISVAVGDPDPYGSHVVGIALCQFSGIGSDFQMELSGGGKRSGTYDFSVLYGIQSPYGGVSAPVADIFAVELNCVGVGQLVSQHDPCELKLVFERHVVDAAYGRGYEAVVEKFLQFAGISVLRSQQISNRIVDKYGTVTERLEIGVAEFPDEGAVFVQSDSVCVGERVDSAQHSSRIVADIHGGPYFQNRRVVLLHGVYGSGKFMVSERIRNSVIAHPVAGAEILVGWVVEHAPFETPRVLTGCHGCVHDAGVPESMFLPVFHFIEGLGREHVAVGLRYEQTL